MVERKTLPTRADFWLSKRADKLLAWSTASVKRLLVLSAKSAEVLVSKAGAASSVNNINGF